MIIFLPAVLDVISSLKFINYLDSIIVKSDVIFDFSDIRKFRPFGMLIISSKIREFGKKNKNFKITAVNFEKHDYAAYMGFFQSMHLNYGIKLGEIEPHKNYIPISYKKIDELREEAGSKNILIPQYIEEYFSPLASVLARNNIKTYKIFLYAIREIIRNIEEHSESNEIWYTGQFWPSYELVEISILDEGIGIRKSLNNNGYYKFDYDETALLMSLQPGISKAFKGKQKENNIYDNSGYGLFMTSQLCKYGGYFTICSSNKSITLKNGMCIIRNVNFSGTAIQMHMRVPFIDKAEDILKNISIHGVELSKKYDGFKKPSKSSLLQSLTET